MIKITEKNFEILEITSSITLNRNISLEKYLIVNGEITEEIFDDVIESNYFINCFSGEIINNFKVLKNIMSLEV